MLTQIKNVLLNYLYFVRLITLVFNMKHLSVLRRHTDNMIDQKAGRSTSYLQPLLLLLLLKKTIFIRGCSFSQWLIYHEFLLNKRLVPSNDESQIIA